MTWRGIRQSAERYGLAGGQRLWSRHGCRRSVLLAGPRATAVRVRSRRPRAVLPTAKVVPRRTNQPIGIRMHRLVVHGLAFLLPQPNAPQDTLRVPLLIPGGQFYLGNRPDHDHRLAQLPQTCLTARAKSWFFRQISIHAAHVLRQATVAAPPAYSPFRAGAASAAQPAYCRLTPAAARAFRHSPKYRRACVIQAPVATHVVCGLETVPVSAETLKFT